MEKRMENKKEGRQSLLICGAALAAACCVFFSACGNREIVGQQEQIVPEEQQETAQEQEEQPEQLTLGQRYLPPVTGPDENGRFPTIPEEEFDKYVTIGPPDPRPEKIEDVENTPFLESADCTQWLEKNFPEINDWQVLFEESTLRLWEGMYDPYRYQWRDQWLPHRVTVLGTQQSADFDRLVLISFKDIFVTVEPNEQGEGIDCPQWETTIYCCTGWASQMDGEGYTDAKAVYYNERAYYPTLYFTKQNRLLLLDFGMIDMNSILSVAEADSLKEPIAMYINGSLTDYFPQTQAEEDRIVYLYQGDDDTEAYKIYYYYGQSQRLVPFEGCTSPLPQLFPLNDLVLTLLNNDSLHFYDLASDAPTTPFLTFGSTEVGGTWDSPAYIMYTLATERENPDKHAIMYYLQGEQEWRVCTFTTRGEILSDFSTGLPGVGDYMGDINYTGGLVYFTYYPNGTGALNPKEYYCVDVRPGKSHAIQRTR